MCRSPSRAVVRPRVFVFGVISLQSPENDFHGEFSPGPWAAGKLEFYNKETRERKRESAVEKHGISGKETRRGAGETSVGQPRRHLGGGRGEIAARLRGDCGEVEGRWRRGEVAARLRGNVWRPLAREDLHPGQISARSRLSRRHLACCRLSADRWSLVRASSPHSRRQSVAARGPTAQDPDRHARPWNRRFYGTQEI